MRDPAGQVTTGGAPPNAHRPQRQSEPQVHGLPQVQVAPQPQLGPHEQIGPQDSVFRLRSFMAISFGSAPGFARRNGWLGPSLSTLLTDEGFGSYTEGVF